MLVPSRLRRELQRAAVAGLYTPVWSPWVIQETWRILAWKWAEKLGGGGAQRHQMGRAANAMFFYLDEVCELVVPEPPYPAVWPSLRDPFDAPVFAAAVAGHCQFVVSNNTHDFLPGRVWSGVRYVTGLDFLAGLGWDFAST